MGVNKDRLGIYKERMFVKECVQILRVLKQQGVKIQFHRFPKNEIDILLYVPLPSPKLILIECIDWAPLYVPYIQVLKQRIREKTQNQLNDKREFIKNDPKKIVQLFRLRDNSFEIKLVGISRIKCQDLPDIKFFTDIELEENPELIIK